MNEINRNNYEIFFLDYYEGNLSAQQKADLFLFLELHLDLKNEFENFEIVKIPAQNISFDEKENLKRELITSKNYQEYLIANLEGDLNNEEKQELNKFLFQHPELKKDEQLFSLTKLSADESVVYDEKLKLKRAIPVSENKKRIFYFSIAAAACILLLLGVYFINQHGPENMQAINEPKNEMVPVAKNNDSDNTIHKDVAAENADPAVKSAHAMEKEKSLNKDKNDFADNSVIIKKEKNSGAPKNSNETNLANTAIKTDEIIIPVSKKEIDKIETASAGEEKINPINIELLRAQLNTDAELNAYLDNATAIESKSNVVKEDRAAAKVKQQKTALLGLVARSISVLSNEDVTVRKKFDAQGDLVAYQLEAGKFKFGTPSDH